MTAPRAKPSSLDGSPLRGVNMPAPFWAQGDVVTWEVTYRNGRVLREREGAVYAQIERGEVTRFALVMPGEVLFETWPPDEQAGRRLLYRRRTTIAPGEGRGVGFLVGWVPELLWWIDPGSMSYRESPGFVVGDPDFAPVPPVAVEHWDVFLPDNLRLPA